MFRIFAVFLSGLAVALLASTSEGAVTVDLGTGITSNWVVTGGGAVNAPAFNHNTGEISITSDGSYTGTFATGGTVSDFKGFWYTDNYFTLPANAQNPTFTFSGLKGDGRVILELNGTILGDYFLMVTNSPATGAGVFKFSESTGDVPYTFTAKLSGTDTADLNIGTVNDLRILVNNTLPGTSLSKATATWQSITDFTHGEVNASLSYTLPVPEPTSLGVLGIGMAGLLVRRRRRI